MISMKYNGISLNGAPRATADLMEKRKRKNSCSDDEDPAAVIESQGRDKPFYIVTIAHFANIVVGPVLSEFSKVSENSCWSKVARKL